MKKNSDASNRSDSDYRNRMMASIAIVELLAIALVLFWPNLKSQERVFQDVIESPSNIQIDEVRNTSQDSKPPPPPRPQVPIPVPNDQIVEEDPIEFSDISLESSLMPLNSPSPESKGSSDQITSNPRISANPRGIVEPKLVDELRDKYKGLTILIRFVITKNGSVDEAKIVEGRRYSKNGEDFTIVRDLPSELVNSVLSAAYQWTFNPAYHYGEPVKSYTNADFTFK